MPARTSGPVNRDVRLTIREAFLEIPEIVTQRLRVSQLTANDAPAMFEYRSDPKIYKYQSFEPYLLSDVEAFISNFGSNTFDEPGTWCQFAIHLQDADKLIGDVGIHFIADDSRQVEVGFTVAHDYQGMGYGSEAVTGVLDFLFVSLQKHRVFASVDPRNRPSVALLKRVGMRQEAQFRESLWFKGEWVDDMVFAVLKSEWLGR